MKQTRHIHLVPRLVSRAIPLFPRVCAQELTFIPACLYLVAFINRLSGRVA